MQPRLASSDAGNWISSFCEACNSGFSIFCLVLMKKFCVKAVFSSNCLKFNLPMFRKYFLTFPYFSIMFLINAYILTKLCTVNSKYTEWNICIAQRSERQLVGR